MKGNQTSRINFESRLQESETALAITTTTMKDLIREFHTIEKRNSGGVSEIEALKSSLDEMRHQMLLKGGNDFGENMANHEKQNIAEAGEKSF